MLLATEQYQALQQMGIPVWELRSQHDEDIAEAAPALSVDLTNVSHVVICDVPVEASPEQRLLNAILIALRFPQQNLAVLTASQAVIHQQQLVAKNVISFADVEPDLNIPSFPSLKTLLDKPELKSVVWTSLKASI